MTHVLTSQEVQPIILCVEDEEELRRDIADELTEAGYVVIEACNGKDALELLRTIRPDLILCDISMPGLGGYGVLEAVQAKGPDFADIPFVFLSALAAPMQMAEGKRLGADDYLVKPIDYDLLVATVQARVRQILRLRSSQPVFGERIEEGTLSIAFGLTPSEARVAIALTEGKTLAQTALDFGISRTTVAYHMRNIFQKTSTNRQAELVAQLLRFSDKTKR